MNKYITVIILAAVAIAVVLVLGYYEKAADKPPATPVPHRSSTRPETAEEKTPGMGTTTASPQVVEGIDFSGIEKPAGGKTIAEVYAGKKAMEGKEVLVRGKVVKFTPSVMGKNWLHVRDGTGDDLSNDLTVTTGTTARIGDTVLVRGIVSLDKDFGFGFEYDIIIEDAEVAVE